VLISTPAAVKALALKFVELLHMIDQAKTDYVTALHTSKKGHKPPPKQLSLTIFPLREQAEICLRVLDLFRAGTLIIDEVDLVLHPLKSELNFPIGRKEPLDLTNNKVAKGVFNFVHRCVRLFASSLMFSVRCQVCVGRSRFTCWMQCFIRPKAA
jgi:hypothetical protein